MYSHTCPFVMREGGVVGSASVPLGRGGGGGGDDGVWISFFVIVLAGRSQFSTLEVVPLVERVTSSSSSSSSVGTRVLVSSMDDASRHRLAICSSPLERMARSV